MVIACLCTYDVASKVYYLFVFFFFFQAEDGIRDLTVTGVQTCALPICPRALACLPAEAPAHPRCRLPAWRDRRRGRLPLHEPPGPGGDLRDRSTRGGEDPRFAGECRLGGMDAARPARQRTQLHLQPSPPHTRSRPDAHSHDDLDALDW